MLPKGLNKDWAGLILGVVSLALCTFVLKFFQFEQFLYNVTLVYIIIVLLVASNSGLWQGIIVSILSFLCLNYFFISPYYTLFIDSGAGIVAVLGFLIASIITSQIAAYARNQTQQAHARQQEIIALNELNIAVLQQAEATPILRQVVEQVTINIGAKATFIYLAHAEQLTLAAVYPPTSQSDLDLRPEIAQVAFLNKQANYLRADKNLIAYLPLLGGDQALGVMVAVVKPTSEAQFTSFLRPENKRWLTTLANQAALAIEHIRLIQETAQIASLKQTDRLKSALLASVSHELRTPLTAIKTAVAGLSDDESDLLEPLERKEYLDIIDEETDRLGHLISNLLDLSRIEAGTFTLRKGLYNLPEIVSKTVDRFLAAKLLKNHAVQTDFQQSLPLISVDYSQIEQVVANLIENAIKYSPPNTTITLKITLHNSTMEQPSGLLVEVIDEGLGVPQNELERVFDKFYRLDNTQNIKGTGLGLAICKGIIEAHGGKIWVTPRLYGGSIFSFWLPSIYYVNEE